MKACELRAMLNQIPDDAELKFSSDMIYLDDCVIEKYPEEYLNGHPPFYYLKPVADGPSESYIALMRLEVAKGPENPHYNFALKELEKYDKKE